MVGRLYQSCIIYLAGYDTWVILIILGIVEFEFYLGTDWLSPHHSIMDCFVKIVTYAWWLET